MRIKILTVFAVLFLCGTGHTFKIGNGYDILRSTEISGAIANIQVATGPVYFHGIIVSSGNLHSTFQYRNSSMTATSGSAYDSTLGSYNNSINSVIPSTSVVYQIDGNMHGNFIYIGDYLAEGLNVTTTGTSHIRILWDWLNNVPAGQEKKGMRK